MDGQLVDAPFGAILELDGMEAGESCKWRGL